MKHPNLTRKLRLERRALVSDGAGGYSSIWETVGTLWTHVAASPVNTALGEGTTLTASRLMILVRAAPWNDPRRPRAGQRFVEGERVFAIKSVAEEDPTGRYLSCRCEEELAI